MGCLLRCFTFGYNRPFQGFLRHLARGANTVNITLITVNVWDFGPLETAITTLQRGGLPTFTTTFNHDSFIDIIHSTENEAIKKVRRS